MCGITGIINLKAQARIPTEETIFKMSNVLKHRGPDGSGVLFSEHFKEGKIRGLMQKEHPDARIIQVKDKSANPFFIAHRRLSIIDLTQAAAQPMTDYSQRFWIVFNGEIYNHQSLRTTLEGKGYHFITDHSDTEVLLNAYAEWGANCLQHLNGMFAFCLWDSAKDEYFFARDRMGIKPFYYANYNGQFYFASEVKSILCDSNIPRTLNAQSINDYLTYLTVPAPATVFEHIYKLPPAHYIYIKQGQQTEPIRYWDPFKNSAYNPNRTEKDLTEELLALLKKSASRRMLADVEVGALLSGGLDSSTNLALISQNTDKKIKTFSIGFNNDFVGYENEFVYSREVAQKFDTTYFEKQLSPMEFNDFFDKMIFYQDEPIADTANIPIYYISKKAKSEGVTVLLGGEGSDEILLGYPFWQKIFAYYNSFEKSGNKSLVHLVKSVHKLPYLKHKRPLYKFFYDKTLNDQTCFWSSTEVRTEIQKKRTYSPEFLKDLGDRDAFNSIACWYNEFKASGRTSYYDWMSYLELNFRLPELLLARLDRMTMAASVEGRVPFLDHEFVEFCMSIPPKQKLKNNISKYLLKESVSGIIPHHIIHRSKKGFPVPLEQVLLQGQNKERYLKLLQQMNEGEHIFSHSYLKHGLREENSRTFWSLANLAVWYDKLVA